MSDIVQDIDVVRIDESVQLLKEYVKDTSIEPFVSALEALSQDPQNESLLVQLTETFASLGIVQGAILTYAPYLALLLANDLFEDD